MQGPQSSYPLCLLCQIIIHIHPLIYFYPNYRKMGKKKGFEAATDASLSYSSSSLAAGGAGGSAVEMRSSSRHPTSPVKPGPATTAKPPPKGAAGRGASTVDMWAHNGLRGAAAVWIVLFHCYGLPKRSELQLNLQGKKKCIRM